MGFNYDLIRVLHLESSSKCNASCPQCDRYDPNQSIIETELSLSKVTKFFPISFISQLEKVFMCGSYGDPATCTETIPIFDYFKTHNPKITIGMNTNGGIQPVAWWKNLAKTMNNPTDYVVFSIDGLEDTNHIYRRNVVWKTVMRNAQAFIDAGGSAHWDMLVFKHNQHQVDECLELATNMGFTWFRSKMSNRFTAKPVSFLSPSDDYMSETESTTKLINCHALAEKSIYVTATGHALPCCWIGSKFFDHSNTIWQTIDKKLIDLSITPIENVAIKGNFEEVSKSWHSNTPVKICKINCTMNVNSKTPFQRQFSKEIQIK